MTREPLRELSLFSGAGGGLLASLLLGWQPVGYVEWDIYCQRVIAARIKDGYLPAAPIFTDVREFLQSGAAAEYRGVADVVSGGFPCQPFSLAGKRAGADDARNMWPATIECIRTVRPRYAFLENVPGLVTSGYFGTILGDLAESGYDVRWRVLSAAEVGAPHKRDRRWIVAYAESQQAVGIQQRGVWGGAGGCRDEIPDTEGERCSRASDTTRQARWLGIKPTTWWETEPRLGRLADGVADRVDRLKALGNGQVPTVAAEAWCLLTEEA